jgi:iron(III) transport system permease protein
MLTTYSLRLVEYNYAQAANGVTLLIVVIAIFGAVVVQRFLRVKQTDGMGT